jgi:hypothetical protein
MILLVNSCKNGEQVDPEDLRDQFFRIKRELQSLQLAINALETERKEVEVILCTRDQLEAPYNGQIFYVDKKLRIILNIGKNLWEIRGPDGDRVKFAQGTERALIHYLKRNNYVAADCGR